MAQPNNTQGRRGYLEAHLTSACRHLLRQVRGRGCLHRLGDSHDKGSGHARLLLHPLALHHQGKPPPAQPRLRTSSSSPPCLAISSAPLPFCCLFAGEPPPPPSLRVRVGRPVQGLRGKPLCSSHRVVVGLISSWGLLTCLRATLSAQARKDWASTMQSDAQHHCLQTLSTHFLSTPLLTSQIFICCQTSYTINPALKKMET